MMGVSNRRRRAILKTATIASLLAFAEKLGVSGQARAQTAPPLRVRRNVSTMADTDPFFADYGLAITKLHEATDAVTWRSQAMIHLEHCKHGNADFLPWHRHYLAFFEQICGALIGKPDFALAYWDWTSNRGRLPAPFFADGPLNVTFWNDPSNAQSDNWGPFPVETIGTRGISANVGLQDDPQRGGAFTPARIESIQRLTDYSLYWQRMATSPHNNGHVVSGAPDGHMIDGLSSLDPCFWLHHCNVDRLWAEWQRAGNTTPTIDSTYVANFVDPAGAPLTVTAASAISAEEMGFTYDTLTDPQIMVGPANVDVLGEQGSLDLRSLAVATSVIGTAAVTARALPDVVTALDVAVPDLALNLVEGRVFQSTAVFAETRLAVEPRRILARLKNVRPSGPVSRILVNVFVNCPYLSPETPASDPHYADSIAFFGPSGGSHHGGEVGLEFLVDITEPLRIQAGEGRISAADISVQLMPITANRETDDLGDVSFEIESIEIVSV